MNEFKQINNLKEFTNQVNQCILKNERLIPNLQWCEINFALTLPIKSDIVAKFQRDQGIPESQEFYFWKCKFKKELTIKNYDSDLYFDDCEFSELELENTVFKKKVRFRECHFYKKTRFENTVFSDLADFWRSTFHEKTIFLKTDFLGTAVFSGTTFEENVLFTYSLISENLILRGANFERGLDLSLANISGDLSLFDIRLNEYTSVDDKPDTLEYENAVGQEGIIFTTNKRETFRIIKHNFLSHNDSVAAQKYSLLESVTHRKHVGHSFVNNLNSTDLWDYILLFLNRVSNKHTTSYIRGFGFTILFGLLAFFFIAWSSKTYEPAENFGHFDFGLAVSHFVQFLTPTHKFDYIEKNPPGQFYFLDFLGRIIIAYGIYQTIQAFRKFR